MILVYATLRESSLNTNYRIAQMDKRLLPNTMKHRKETLS